MTAKDKLSHPIQLGPNIVADGDSEVLNARGAGGIRIIVSEVAGGTADIQPQGSAERPVAGAITNPYPMGSLKSLGANETWTRWIGEPNAYINVNVANVAGAEVKVQVQRFGA